MDTSAKKNKCCVVLISYKETLKPLEELSFKRAINVFGGNRDIKLIIPDNIKAAYYEEYGNLFEIITVNHKWLSSYKEYNTMCTNKEFYELFSDYEYILIYQTDCWVFEDKLDYFIDLGYDYYGAPWKSSDCAAWGKGRKTSVGNGGFSLRNVDKMIEITSRYNPNCQFVGYNEDGWFCFTHGNKLNICDVKNACNFSFEKPSEEISQNIYTCPMGLHGRFNIKFWDSDGTRFKEFKNKILGK